MNTTVAQLFDAIGDTIFRRATDGVWCWGTVVWRRRDVVMVDLWIRP